MVQSKKGETLIWGRAKVEFAALYQDIKILLEKEYPKTMLYESLRKEKKILMSYRRFCELVCKHFPEKAGKSKNMEKSKMVTGHIKMKLPYKKIQMLQNLLRREKRSQ